MSEVQVVEVPAGYRKDARGALVPEQLIKPVDLARDVLVQEIVQKAREMNEIMAKFKASIFGDIEAFVEMSAEEYGVKLGGQKGNLSLMSFDGRLKVNRAVQERINFDERLQAAKALIDECLHDWTEGASPELQALIGAAFATNKEGEINTGRVLALRRYEITDERWIRAMNAISEAVQVVGSKSYIRVYERIGESGEYLPIALDMAGV
ncbi:DUF3164 family protein [Leeia sp. TBRC 13508]|uniref:DUF3164 family protein n=1 Tax=Leeia speluncae TaxID=2884804 RepID=A0ABS8D2B6_9NEIS|nr:DUF3164 family protein [Leeia speluncae]MCB6182341.1 DUF3164 family protein [Leeia speluncae]